LIVIPAQELLFFLVLSVPAALCSSFRRRPEVLFNSRRLVIKSFGVSLSPWGQGAAYAAGVSNGCRRSSHFSLAGPREK
jgi:hypothetical protein